MFKTEPVAHFKSHLGHGKSLEIPSHSLICRLSLTVSSNPEVKHFEHSNFSCFIILFQWILSIPCFSLSCFLKLLLPTNVFPHKLHKHLSASLPILCSFNICNFNLWFDLNFVSHSGQVCKIESVSLS